MISLLSVFIAFIALCCIVNGFRKSFAPVMTVSSFLKAKHEVLVYDASHGKYYVGDSKNIGSSSDHSSKQRSGKGGGKPYVRDIDQVRRSGEIFLKKPNRRPLPWWMKDSERNHPRILPVYKPWWMNPQNPIVNPSWTVPELRAEATRRGAHCSHWNKQQLLDWLKESSTDYNLSEMNFKGPTFTNSNVNITDSCYPEIYGKLDPNSGK